MLRITDDVVEVRRWAESRGAHPCRDADDGTIRLRVADDPCAIPVGWDEFESAFCLARSVLVYDAAPGSRSFFLGGAEEARRFVEEERPGTPM